MNNKAKAILGILRSIAVGIGVSVASTALDQTVRSAVNEIIKKRANKANEEKK